MEFRERLFDARTLQAAKVCKLLLPISSPAPPVSLTILRYTTVLYVQKTALPLSLHGSSKSHVADLPSIFREKARVWLKEAKK